MTYKPAAEFALEASATTKSLLGELWRETLQISDMPDAKANFLDLGGDSMTLSLLTFRIKEEFGIEIPVELILGCDSLGDMAALIESTQQTGESVVSDKV